MTAEQAEPYERAAEEIRRLADAHDTAMDTFARRVADGLHGPAGLRIVDEARGHRDAMHDAFSRAWEEVAALIRRHGGHHGIGPALARSGFGGYLSGSGSVRGVDENALHQAMREARNRGTALCDAGRRLAAILSRAGANPSPGHQVQEIGDWLLGQDHELRRRLNQALAAEAVLTDAFAGLNSGIPTLAERLAHLTDAQNGTLAQLHQIRRLPPSRERAQQTAAWWKTLTPADQQRFTDLFPRTIGTLDGLPAEARHRANINVLATDPRRLKAELAAMPRTGPQGEPINVVVSDRIQKQLAVLAVLQREIDKANFKKNSEGELVAEPDDRKRAYLLGLDIDHRKVIFSYGNPDTADNITTFVPGFGTTITSTEDNLERARRTRGAAVSADERQATASIYWLDYPTPLALDVVTADNAEDGAPRLGGFMRGIQAAHGSGDARFTMLGHSYGSLTCGKAAVDFPQIADELIFVGSPGVGVDRASELGVSPEHVWASAADNDLVSGLPPLPWILIPGGREHAESEGITAFGVDPTHPRFYGRTFDSQAGPAGIGGEHGIAAHSVYWDLRSPSLRNIAHIIVGQDPAEYG